MFLETDPLQKPLEASVDSAKLEQKLCEAESQNTSLVTELTELQDDLSERKEEVAPLQDELCFRSGDEEAEGQFAEVKGEIQASLADGLPTGNLAGGTPRTRK